MRSGLLARALGAALATTALGIACYGATEVRLTFVSDLPCDARLRLRVVVEEDVLETQPAACRPQDDGNYLGSLVVVPRGDREARVRVEATLARFNRNPGVDCAVFPEDCVVTSRAFRFLLDETRNLVVRRDEACRNVKSCEAGKTCDRGKCIGEDVDAPQPPSDPPPVAEGGVDGGPGVVDAGPQRCVGPSGNDVLQANEPRPADHRIAANATTLFWVRPDAPLGVVVARDKAATASTTLPGISAIAVAAVSDGVFALRPNAYVRASGKGLTTQKVCTSVEFSSPQSFAVEPGSGSYLVFVSTNNGPQPAIGYKHPLDDLSCQSSYVTHPFFNAQSLELENGYLYGRLGDRIVRIERDNAAASPETIEPSNASAFALAPGLLYTAVVPDATGTTIGVRATSDITKTLAIATGRGPVLAMAARDGVVYWVEQPPNAPATIWRSPDPKLGASPVQLTPDANPYAEIRGLAVDADCLYFWGRRGTADNAVRVLPNAVP